MSLTFKLLSLAIRTAAKPIGNYIKRQAKEHEGFRRFAIARAQQVHRIDMRMRLGLLHDADAQQRMHEREQRAAEEQKRKEETPTVRSALEQKKYDEQRAKDEKDGKPAKKKDEPVKVKIRPLNEAKAIELGANFFSESFIFAVAVGLLVWDNWRSRRKEQSRRDDVVVRIEELETEVERLRARYEPHAAIPEKAKPEKRYSWWNPAGWWTRTDPETLTEDGIPVGGTQIPGSVPGPDPAAAVKPTAAVASKPEEAAKAASKAKDASPVVKEVQAAKTSPREAPERVDTVSAGKKER